MRRALGKGLTQLLGEQGEAAPTSIEVTAIRPNSRQPRRYFDETALKELAQSISQVGLLLPLIVRPIADGEYELIAGERRLRAAKLAGLEEVPVIVRAASAQDSLQMALIENVQREDISAVDCAVAFRQLSDDFGLTQEQIADVVGKSRVAVANTLRLLRLPEFMQRAIAEGMITEGHARALLMVESPQHQEALYEQIVKEGLSVREAEKLARVTHMGDETVNGVTETRAEPSERDPNLDALEREMSVLFGSPVKIVASGKGGRITVPYYSDEELQRILDLLGIEL
ncbi:MAG: ParB/RepB/Spo0J family partition protein [Fimbriimonadaceae bacterium]